MLQRGKEKWITGENDPSVNDPFSFFFLP